VRTADFDFLLPPHLIAQTPANSRDASRLLVLRRDNGVIEHRSNFRDLLEYLRSDDVIVLNDSRVIPARLRARKDATGGEVEVLLLREVSLNEWWAMLRPAKRVRVGSQLRFEGRGTTAVSAELLEKTEGGHCRLRFTGTSDLRHDLSSLGEIPLPPYITRPPTPEDWERYQTVFATRSGSVAAPTAGLHFTTELLDRIQERGIEVQRLTLHIGPGTFAPVKSERLEEHEMHEEFFVLSPTAAERINAARQSGRRIVAVGTTTVRVLESVAAQNDGQLVGSEGRTRIFIYPPYRFRIVDVLLTNFHLPQSTLLMLVSAFAAPGEVRGRELMLQTYEEAVKEGYRFFSYGDAMLLL
jgi:S-adenosylmethionine:tRNA ribosyltransferase-isomerase